MIPVLAAEIEVRVAHEMYPGVSKKAGVNPGELASWFARQGMSATWGTGRSRTILLWNLKNGIPTMVEWIDGGGHGVVVAGYDVIIFADSVDCHDDQAVGITYLPDGRSDATLFDAHYFPKNLRDQADAIAIPGNTPHPA